MALHRPFVEWEEQPRDHRLLAGFFEQDARKQFVIGDYRTIFQKCHGKLIYFAGVQQPKDVVSEEPRHHRFETLFPRTLVFGCQQHIDRIDDLAQIFRAKFLPLCPHDQGKLCIGICPFEGIAECIGSFTATHQKIQMQRVLAQIH